MPDEVEEEKFANFRVDFPTWTVSFEKKYPNGVRGLTMKGRVLIRSGQGKC